MRLLKGAFPSGPIKVTRFALTWPPWQFVPILWSLCTVRYCPATTWHPHSIQYHPGLSPYSIPQHHLFNTWHLKPPSSKYVWNLLLNAGMTFSYCFLPDFCDWGSVVACRGRAPSLVTNCRSVMLKLLQHSIRLFALIFLLLSHSFESIFQNGTLNPLWTIWNCPPDLTMTFRPIDFFTGNAAYLVWPTDVSISKSLSYTSRPAMNLIYHKIEKSLK